MRYGDLPDTDRPKYRLSITIPMRRVVRWFRKALGLPDPPTKKHIVRRRRRW